MNARPQGLPLKAAAPAPVGFAMVTASYAPDFERCRLLCETMDRHVSGVTAHYILVEPRDVSLFRSLERPGRTVIDERDLLPSWLRPFDDPLSLMKRRIWLSLRTMPLRGWHVQQLRRIAIADAITEDTLVYVDSDVAFVKPFDLGVFRRGGKARLFRRDGALMREALGAHRRWARTAAEVLGLDAPDGAFHDYISTLIAWDRATVRAMCARIESVTGRSWIEAVGIRRHFSECLLYGRYVDEVIAGDGHVLGSEELCQVQWGGSSLSDEAFREVLATLKPEQGAIAVQSFIGTDPIRIRRLLEQA